METLYRKVAVSERMPEKDGNYYTEQGFVTFEKGTFWQYEGRAFVKSNSNITNYLEPITDPTAQLREEIETLVECDIPTVMSNYGKADGTRDSSINYNEGHQNSWKKGFKKALEITNPNISQLQADKAELLEALERVVKENTSWYDTNVEIESLIQKMKQ